MKRAFTQDKLAYYLSLAIGLILALLPFHAFFTTWAGATWGHLDAFRIWKELLLVPIGLGALWLAWRDKHLKLWLKTDPLVYLIGLFLVAQLILGLAAYWDGNVNRNALIYAWLSNTRFLVFFVMCALVAAKSDWLRLHWKRLVLIPAAIVVIFGLLQLWVLPANVLTHVGYGPKTVMPYQTVDQKPQYVRIQSTLRGPNPLGAYLVLIMSLLAALLLTKRGRRNWKVMAMIAGTVIVLLFTYSRSAWLGTILSLALLCYGALKHDAARRWIMIGVAIVVVVASGAFLALRNNNTIQNTLFHTSNTSRSPESSNAARTQALENGAKSLITEPFGRGPGTAGPASVRNNAPPRIAENYYIQVGQEVGIIGLVIFIGINLLVGYRLYRQQNDLLAQVLFVSLIGITFINMLSHTWADDTLSLLWWGLAGIALSPNVVHNLKAQPTK